jgi:hypothetical protein
VSKQGKWTEMERHRHMMRRPHSILMHSHLAKVFNIRNNTDSYRLIIGVVDKPH